jgi:3-deoxy-D-manno-octulosonate 8-phosphate phosphatase (KDO 8-P phosphatase)
MDVKLVMTDIDGVWTDGGMYYGAGGEELKKFNTSDSAGVLLLRAARIPLAIITGENSPIVTNRAAKLKVEHVIMDTVDKLGDAQKLCKKMEISLSQVAYIGDDIGDIALLEAAGLSACPAGTPAYVARHAQLKMKLRGGEGVFREFVETLLENMGLLEESLAKVR